MCNKDKLIEIIKRALNGRLTVATVKKLAPIIADAIITDLADVDKAKGGQWIVKGDITECSNCHKEYVTARGMLQLKEFDYCPRCGKKTKEGAK